MSPPIREGSGDSIGAIRLGDGSEISEVRTGAGDVLFSAGPPDSVIAQYDATQETQTGTDILSSINDRIGSFKLTSGTNVSVVSGINGKQVYRFNGSQALGNATNYVTSNVDFAVIFVFQFQETPHTNEYMFGTEGNALEFALQDNDNPQELQIHRGGSGNVGTGFDVDQNPHIGVLEAFDGGDAKLRVDGTDSPDGQVSTNDSDLEGLAIGSRDSSQTGEAVQIDYGEFEVLKDPAAADITNEESRLSDKWGIAI